MDNFNRFNETKLPRKESFYSSLNDEHNFITNEEYQHAKDVYREFRRLPRLVRACMPTYFY